MKHTVLGILGVWWSVVSRNSGNGVLSLIPPFGSVIRTNPTRPRLRTGFRDRSSRRLTIWIPRALQDKRRRLQSTSGFLVAIMAATEDTSTVVSDREESHRRMVPYLSEWTPLNPESLVAAPCLLEQTLCQPSNEQPQLAKDKLYAQAVLEAWKQEEEDSENVWETEWCHCQYYASIDSDDGHEDENDGIATTPLYGHIIRKIQSPQANNNNSTTSSTQKYPGIVLFHTGAGPHDLFLLYKAAALVNHSWKKTTSYDKNNDGDKTNDETSVDAAGCIVFVADVLSDETGWAWNPDRSRYQQEQSKLLFRQPEGDRSVLRKRVQAALTTLQDHPTVDSDRMAALGWCLGGHAIMEVAKLQATNIRAMATFHGVFDGCSSSSIVQDKDRNNGPPKTNLPTPLPIPPIAMAALAQVLICHGVEDLFVPNESLQEALTLLQSLQYHRTCLLQLAGAKHGFTNPAQDYNDNPAFAYNAAAATKAWNQVLGMLQQTLFFVQEE